MPKAQGYAKVIVDIASQNTDRVFDYLIPEGLALSIGTRVRVPFGHQSLDGVVVAFSDTSAVPGDKLKAIDEALEDYPAILPALVSLAEQISQQTHCPLALSLRLMIPPELRSGKVRIKTQTLVRLAIPKTQVQAALSDHARAPKRRLLINLLQDGQERLVHELRVLVRNPLPALRVLEKAGIVSLREGEVFRSPYADPGTPDPDLVLSPEQEEVLSELVPAIRAGKGNFLLHGITGSGKTEVYIRAAKEALALGKGVIVLVPEIVLTPQMVSWFRGRFGDVAAVLHSRLSAGERFDEWRRIRSGQARLVIGARSAVFAPVDQLGLIVVDEEHEPSYQAEHNPRYDAREMATSRAAREGACLLLASATPSILTFAKAQRGDYTLLEMLSRVSSSRLATVSLVDMREELRLGNRGMFSSLLMERLLHCMASGQQAMLFINRRGYAPSMLCLKCGESLGCRQCDVKLTYHQADQQLHCHYCGFSGPVPSRCPSCDSQYLKPVGTGTQKVQDELAKLFPDVDILRMDYDTTTGKDAHQALLNRFRSGAARIMVGTQMIAKGLDFPQVTLVGVVLADLSLNLPDYRSAERTFQLLTQVAGRAGRSSLPGEVIIQTYKPEDFAIQAAASQDYRSFFKEEFDRRRQNLYPPFTMMARLLCEARDEATARLVSAQLKDRLTAYLVEHPKLKRRVIFYREDTAPIKRLFGRARSQLLIKLLEHPDSQQILRYLQDLSQEAWPCTVNLEVNPTNLA